MQFTCIYSRVCRCSLATRERPNRSRPYIYAHTHARERLYVFHEEQGRPDFRDPHFPLPYIYSRVQHFQCQQSRARCLFLSRLVAYTRLSLCIYKSDCRFLGVLYRDFSRLFIWISLFCCMKYLYWFFVFYSGRVAISIRHED